MKTLKCRIQIGWFAFKYVVDLSVTKSIDNFTQSAAINLSRKAEWKGKKIAFGEDSLLKVGYDVEVKAGYSNDLPIVFEGYLNSIKPGTRVELEAQDKMYLLKQDTFNKSYKTVDLVKLMDDIIPGGIEVKTVNAKLGKFRIVNATAAQVLDTLKKDYGLYSYFKNGKLLVGLAYWPDEAETHVFDFSRNIKKSSNQLQWQEADDVKLKVKAVSISDNKKYTVEVGDSEGEQRTLHFYDVPESELKERAEQELAKLKYAGYKGKFEAWGEPLVQHGDIVELRDPDYDERTGRYMVKETKYRFGSRGIQQTIEIANKV